MQVQKSHKIAIIQSPLLSKGRIWVRFELSGGMNSSHYADNMNPFIGRGIQPHPKANQFEIPTSVGSGCPHPEPIALIFAMSVKLTAPRKRIMIKPWVGNLCLLLY
jgi:hypothetical protein